MMSGIRLAFETQSTNGLMPNSTFSARAGRCRCYFSDERSLRMGKVDVGDNGRSGVAKKYYFSFACVFDKWAKCYQGLSLRGRVAVARVFEKNRAYQTGD